MFGGGGSLPFGGRGRQASISMDDKNSIISNDVEGVRRWLDERKENLNTVSQHGGDLRVGNEVSEREVRAMAGGMVLLC